MRLELDVSKESAQHILDYLENESDEYYVLGTNYPPSNEWEEFRGALEKALADKEQ